MHSNDFSSVCGFVSREHCTVITDEEMMKEKEKLYHCTSVKRDHRGNHTGHAGALISFIILRAHHIVFFTSGLRMLLKASFEVDCSRPLHTHTHTHTHKSENIPCA